METLVPCAVLVPLVVAALIVAGEGRWPRWLMHGAALTATLAAATMAALLARHTADIDAVYWFGGWAPRDGLAVGIDFFVDPLAAVLAGCAALLTGSAFVFSWRYFDVAGGLFHALMLLMSAGMVGFCFAGDLFTLAVFLELMSVAAYALTAHRHEQERPLQGALNFAVANSVGAALLLLGVGLLYGRTGTLNLAEMGRALQTAAGGTADSLVIVALALVAAGLLGKAATVPMHFAHADAHAVAPTPVLVPFSGIMLYLGFYGFARVYWTVFHPALRADADGVAAVLLALGLLTALTGSLMCVWQTGLKRMLAFSTIAHGGVVLCGIAAFDARALAGAVIYALGHGMIKASLFVAAGIALHRFGTVDELELQERGRRPELIAVAVILVAGGVSLAGLPFTGPFAGKALIEEALGGATAGVPVLLTFTSALTGAAVLRVAGRIGAGWGDAGESPGESGEQEKAERETEEDEKDVSGVMWASAVVLLLVGLLPNLAPGFGELMERAAHRFIDPQAYAGRVLHGIAAAPAPLPPPGAILPAVIAGLCGVGLALALAAVSLFRPHRELLVDPPAMLRRALSPLAAAAVLLRGLHNGFVGDYVAWLLAAAAGMALSWSLML